MAHRSEGGLGWRDFRPFDDKNSLFHPKNVSFGKSGAADETLERTIDAAGALPIAPLVFLNQPVLNRNNDTSSSSSFPLSQQHDAFSSERLQRYRTELSDQKTIESAHFLPSQQKSFGVQESSKKTAAERKEKTTPEHSFLSPYILKPNYARLASMPASLRAASLFESSFDVNHVTQEETCETDPLKQQLQNAQQLLQSYFSQRDLLDSKINHQQRIVDELMRRLQLSQQQQQQPENNIPSISTSTTTTTTTHACTNKNQNAISSSGDRQLHETTSHAISDSSRPTLHPTASTTVVNNDSNMDSINSAAIEQKNCASVCLNWNYDDGCLRQHSCPQLHVCAYCGSSDHPGSQCPDHSDNLKETKSRSQSPARDNNIIASNDSSGKENATRFSGNNNILTLSDDILAPIKLVADGKSQSPPLLLPASDVCMNWNAHRCRMGDRCKRFHVCSLCNGPHTALECTGSADEVPPPSVLAKLYDEQIPPTFNNNATTTSYNNNNNNAYSSTASNASYNGYIEVCLNYNNGRCKVSKCRRSHHCSICYDPSHPAFACPDPSLTSRDFIEAGVEICINWNNGRCDATIPHDDTLSDNPTTKPRLSSCIGPLCRRVHICSVCKSPDHPAFKCTWDTDQRSSSPLSILRHNSSSSTHHSTMETSGNETEICMNWNQNRCRMTHERCKRIHACFMCRSRDHRAVDCPRHPITDTDDFVMQTYVYRHPNGSGNGEEDQKSSVDGRHAEDVCLNWNMGRCRMKKCRRAHVCAICFRGEHDQRSCPTLHQTSTLNQ